MNDALTAPEVLALLGNPSLVLTVGLPASRKSTFAATSGLTRLNSDSIRGELWGDEGKQGDPAKVFGVLYGRYRAGLERGDRIIIDNTNLTRRARHTLLKVGRAAGREPLLLVFDSPLAECMVFNKARDRVVPDSVMNEMAADLMNAGPPLQSEADYRAVRPAHEFGKFFLLERGAPLEVYTPSGSPMEKLKVDLIGDVHGCYDELRDLLQLLGWQVEQNGSLPDGMPAYRFSPPEGRLAGFVGDLVDRGPASDKVLNLVEQLVAQKLAVAVQGNHDNKLMRKLKGNNVKVGVALAETLRQIEQHGPDFQARVLAFLKALPFKVETADLIVVHAAYKAGMSAKAFQDLAIYGDVDAEKQVEGAPPVRGERWMAQYEGDKVIVHGHVRLDEVAVCHKPNGASIWNIDTSAAFGIRLTALRFPELALVSVKSRAAYADGSTH